MKKQCQRWCCVFGVVSCLDWIGGLDLQRQLENVDSSVGVIQYLL